MELRYLGFEQFGNARGYRFDLVGGDAEARQFVVTVDLALFRTHGCGHPGRAHSQRAQTLRGFAESIRRRPRTHHPGPESARGRVRGSGSPKTGGAQGGATQAAGCSAASGVAVAGFAPLMGRWRGEGVQRMLLTHLNRRRPGRPREFGAPRNACERACYTGSSRSIICQLSPLTGRRFADFLPDDFE